MKRKKTSNNIISSLDLLNQYEYICFSFIGVGEPLLNYQNVLETIKYLDSKYENVSFALETTFPNVSMIKTITNDFNDSKEDFLELLELLELLEDDDRLKISTYNQIESSKFNKSSEERYELSYKMLDERNIYNSKFESGGDKVDVGCGQMATKRLERIMKNV